LIEAIANILDNAIKFTPPGGSVRLQVTDRGEGPAIRIADTGPGIAPDERAAVMKRFYRIDKSRHVVGSGLGLSIVLAIVQLHDFDIVIGDARPGCSFEMLCYARAGSEAEPARALGLKRLMSPWARLAPETDGTDRIDRPMAPAAVSAAAGWTRAANRMPRWAGR
jgi:Histidine kinase-, DNA gyrase B-, and HSP90-like ATPase